LTDAEFCYRTRLNNTLKQFFFFEGFRRCQRRMQSLTDVDATRGRKKKQPINTPKFRRYCILNFTHVLFTIVKIEKKKSGYYCVRHLSDALAVFQTAPIHHLDVAHNTKTRNSHRPIGTRYRKHAKHVHTHNVYIVCDIQVMHLHTLDSMVNASLECCAQ
jgi:hypothetical protein